MNGKDKRLERTFEICKRKGNRQKSYANKNLQKKKGQYKERKQERNEKGDECEKDKETHECEHMRMKDKHKNVRI